MLELDELRLELARAFKKSDAALSGVELTEVVQRCLERLIFMRFLEDRGIEDSKIIDRIGDGGSAWQNFVSVSRRLDGVYNGLIFRQHTIIDGGECHVDDQVFLSICEKLSSLNSPYDFNSIPIHILGSIYERFLGRVIVTHGRTVQLALKPELRKSGGVYYTPEYVVNYIVEETVGRRIAGKTPSEVDRMHFGDIACGSGSFLLGIYEYLLRNHGSFYNANPERARPGDCETRDGRLYLTLYRKREILFKNVFGMDVDPQAVELTQLSLCLRLLKDETPRTTRQYQLEFARSEKIKKLLPDLTNNIVCGNALINTECLDGQLFGDDEERRLNAIDIKATFPTIFNRRVGGFDLIVGNPPYIRIQTLKRTSPTVPDYLKAQYKSARKGNYDIYVVFTERGLDLLKPDGALGYIVPHKFFNSAYGEPLRNLLGQRRLISHVVHFGYQQVFDGATTYTCLLFLQKSGSEVCRFVQVEDLTKWRNTGTGVVGTIPAERFGNEEWNIVVGDNADLFQRLRQTGLSLGDVADVFVGLQTSADDIFILNLIEERARTSVVQSRKSGATHILENTLLHPLVSGTDVVRYVKSQKRQVIIFPYRVDNEKAVLLDIKSLLTKYPRIGLIPFRVEDRAVAAREWQVRRRPVVSIWAQSESRYSI